MEKESHSLHATGMKGHSGIVQAVECKLHVPIRQECYAVCHPVCTISTIPIFYLLAETAQHDWNTYIESLDTDIYKNNRNLSKQCKTPM